MPKNESQTTESNDRDKDGRRRTLAEGFSDFARPNNGKDWSRLVLGIVAGIAMLLAGRVWGEGMLAATTERAVRNEARYETLTERFEDHVGIQAEANRNILNELQEIRRLLQERRQDGYNN